MPSRQDPPARSSIVDTAIVDGRQALRRIVKSPGLSLVVIVTLALTIAANATIFSLLKPTVLRQINTNAPDALASISATDSKTGAYSAIYLSSLEALESDQRSFTTLAAYVSSIVRVESEGTSIDVGVEGVTADYFTVLETRPKAGRLLSATDAPQAAVGVISEKLAARLFGDATAIGRAIVVDGRQVEVIGVTGNRFEGVRMDGGDDLFLPLVYLRSIATGDPKVLPRAQQLIGRLAPGVTLEAARAEVLGRWPSMQAAAAAQLPAAQQAAVQGQRISVESFARGFSGTRDRYGSSLLLVMALAVALLAVGCVNLSGLMLARALTRQHEFAVRIALGVSRRRLIQQTLIDGVMLSVAALIVAIPISWWASRVLTAMVSVARAIPLENTTPDVTVLLLATAASLATGVVIGVLPAHRAVTRGMDDVLRSRGAARRSLGSARAVLVTQVALSMVLVVGAGLFVSTLSHLYANDVTARSNDILFTRLARNPLERTTVLQQSYFQDLQEQLAAIPGADAAAFSDMYPAYMAFFGALPMDTLTAGPGVKTTGMSDYVTPGFFDLYSIARIRGRDFTWSDNVTSPPVAIVNETLARKLSPSGDVVGSRIQIASGQSTSDVEIVGVVADATVSSIRERHVAAIYRPMMQELRHAQTPMTHVRVTGDAAGVRRRYVEVVNAKRGHFVRAIFTMDGWVDNAVVEQRLIAGMAGFAAALAMTLAAVGLFGLVAYSVSSRVREIGVRMSVGATQDEVVRMIVREGLAVAIPGVLIGVPLALGAATLVRAQLYGVTPTDPWTLAGAAAILIATAAVASWLPARRASRIQPNEALRAE